MIRQSDGTKKATLSDFAEGSTHTATSWQVRCVIETFGAFQQTAIHIVKLQIERPDFGVRRLCGRMVSLGVMAAAIRRATLSCQTDPLGRIYEGVPGA